MYSSYRRKLRNISIIASQRLHGNDIKDNCVNCEHTKMRDKKMFPLRIELRTFRVLSGCDNHYTTETVVLIEDINYHLCLLRHIIMVDV